MTEIADFVRGLELLERAAYTAREFEETMRRVEKAASATPAQVERLLEHIRKLDGRHTAPRRRIAP
jgi:hypothetical protein